MRSREEVKKTLTNLIKNLKSMTEEFEELLSEMDTLSNEEFDKRVEEIEDTYSKYGIELF